MNLHQQLWYNSIKQLLYAKTAANSFFQIENIKLNHGCCFNFGYIDIDSNWFDSVLHRRVASGEGAVSSAVEFGTTHTHPINKWINAVNSHQLSSSFHHHSPGNILHLENEIAIILPDGMMPDGCVFLVCFPLWTVKNNSRKMACNDGCQVQQLGNCIAGNLKRVTWENFFHYG